jgi:hypothetical protein
VGASWTLEVVVVSWPPMSVRRQQRKPLHVAGDQRLLQTTYGMERCFGVIESDLLQSLFSYIRLLHVPLKAGGYNEKPSAARTQVYPSNASRFESLHHEMHHPLLLKCLMHIHIHPLPRHDLVRSASSNLCLLSTAFTTSPNHHACIRESSVNSG